jgi:phosphonate transport system substrate-binding protein
VTAMRLVRRSFLQRIALGAGGMVLLAACQQAPAVATPPPPAPTSPPAPTQVPTAAPATPTVPAPTATTAVQSTVAANATPTPAAASSTSASVDRTGWPTTFTLGLFAGDDPNAVLNSYTPLTDYLQKQVGIEFKSITGTSYSAVIEAMRTNHADAFEVGPFAYILAVQEASAEAIAAVVSAPDSKNPVYVASAQPFYYSMIFTKKGSGINSLADLKGKNFSFVDPASTSGHLMPHALLVKNGINPDTDMKTIYAGSHPSSVLAVWNGKVDAGATFDQSLTLLAGQNQIKLCWFADNVASKARTADEIKQVADSCAAGSIVVLAISDPIPNTPFAVRSNLPKSLKDTIRTSLLGVKDHPEIIKGIGEWYVDPTAALKLDSLDSFYDPLRSVAKVLNLDLKKLVT